MDRRSVLKYAGLSALAGAISDPLTSAAAAVLQTVNTLAPGTVVFNQAGFLPGGEKVASVLQQEPADASFQVVADVVSGSPDASANPDGPAPGHVIFRGTLSAPMLDAASGDRVSLADFSSVSVPGAYRIFAQGRRSERFFISKGVYRDALRGAMRSYYGQRCGCAVDLGGGYRHAACHFAGEYHRSSGRNGAVANHGGWHDAGDYGRYIVNCGITCGTLLWAWELYPQVLQGLSLDIPESGGKLPDYLAEIQWNLEWMLSLQDADGGVWHKQTSEQFCAFILPEQDTLTSYIIGTGKLPYKSTCATADLAAVMAIAARCYGKYDAAFAARFLAAAKRAWKWADAHPDIAFTNPPGIGTGGYDDKHCNDAILWASAELWRTTGEAQYEQAFLSGSNALPPETSIQAPSWPNVAPMAFWTYLLADRKPSDPKLSGPMKDRILKQTGEAAQTLIDRRNASGYGNTLALSDYIWGSNSVAANQSLLLLVAHHFQSNARAVQAALGNLHYLLGRNCFGVSWVTHVGTNPFQHPHHRPSAADGIAAPWPGLLSGGPNAHSDDQVAHTLPRLPPMRMWLDDQSAYSLNEVAINWNAPLVFLLAAANALA
jgi:endoglucanase